MRTEGGTGDSHAQTIGVIIKRWASESLTLNPCKCEWQPSGSPGRGF